MLLIVPGIIWALKFQLYGYFVVDENKDPLEALKASFCITKGEKWNILLLGILIGLLNFAGALFFGIGTFVTASITMIAMAYAYRELNKKSTVVKLVG